MRIKRTDSVLLVIDVQEKLIGTITEDKELVQNIRALVKTAQILAVPVLVTEQEKLGETIPELKTMLGDHHMFRKVAFSVCEISEFTHALRGLGRRTIIACGIEAHICVLQAVLDLLQLGYHVLVASDAVSSHGVADNERALQRMRDAGAMIATTETVIYEWTERAGTEEFKKILEIVKERRKNTT